MDRIIIPDRISHTHDIALRIHKSGKGKWLVEGSILKFSGFYHNGNLSFKLKFRLKINQIKGETCKKATVRLTVSNIKIF